MNEEYILTTEGAKRLRAELAHLKGPMRQKIARKLRAAIQLGDLTENAEYIATKEQQGFIEGRIQELEYLFKRATIVDNSQTDGEIVEVGSKVTVQEEGYPSEIYTLVGSIEADPRERRISNKSPIGQALMGCREGDEVNVQTPGGSIRLKILKIE
jgi:transcription elongation factor GreA